MRHHRRCHLYLSSSALPWAVRLHPRRQPRTRLFFFLLTRRVPPPAPETGGRPQLQRCPHLVAVRLLHKGHLSIEFRSLDIIAQAQVSPSLSLQKRPFQSSRRCERTGPASNNDLNGRRRRRRLARIRFVCRPMTRVVNKSFIEQGRAVQQANTTPTATAFAAAPV